MSKLTEILAKIRRKWTKIRLQPIRVFCFHHVSDAYKSSYMWEEDWTNTDVLKNFMMDMQRDGYTFISLPEAQAKLTNDTFRKGKYAVLTADDGFKTLLNIVPWLIEEQIPITLFINPKYIIENGIGENVQARLDKTRCAKGNEIYLRKSDLDNMKSPLVTIAYHGYEHLDEWKMEERAFVQNVEKCERTLKVLPLEVIPFYAHTYGHAREEYNRILDNKKLTPVYVSGGENYADPTRIDRELISNERIQNGKVHV